MFFAGKVDSDQERNSLPLLPWRFVADSGRIDLSPVGGSTCRQWADYLSPVGDGVTCHAYNRQQCSPGALPGGIGAGFRGPSAGGRGRSARRQTPAKNLVRKPCRGEIITH